MSRGKSMNTRTKRAAETAGLVLLAIVVLSGCRAPQMMANQPQYDPLEKSTAFADQNSARPIIEGTVARGDLDPTDVMLTGKVNGEFVDELPMPLTPELIARGRERFEIFCSPCHGLAAYGDGMIVARGYRKPPSLHTDQLRARKNGYLFDVISNGFGAMPPYRAQIKPEDRWAIVAYERVLQLSQHATLEDVPEEDRPKLDGEPVAAEEHSEGETH